MIIVEELPFSHVEGKSFRNFNRINQPSLNVLCSGTITKDWLTLNLEEKYKLRETFRKTIGMVCLTSDTWTFIKQKSYMTLTAHFIDNDWNLKKKMLNFCLVGGRKGVDIGFEIECCLKEWKFNNILYISVDNANTNKSAMDIFARNHHY